MASLILPRVRKRPPRITSKIVQDGITITFGAAADVGQYFTNGWWVDGQVEVIGISPTWSGTGARHGAMRGTDTHVGHGFDSRVGGYDSDLNVALQLPITLMPGDSLVCTISKNPESLTLGTGGNTTGTVNTITLTCVDGAPAANAFRPPINRPDDVTPPAFTTSDVNYNLLPGLTPPVDPMSAAPAFDWTFAHKFWITRTGLTQSRLKPEANMLVYPAEVAVYLSRMGCYAVCDFPDAHDIANALIQKGIDWYYTSLFNGTSFRAGAGFGHGNLFPILFAGHLLENEDILNPPRWADVEETEPKFAEQNSYYSHTGAYSGYLLPKDRAEYPDGPPLYGDRGTSTSQNSSSRNIELQEAANPNAIYDAQGPKGGDYHYPVGIYSYGGTYMQCCSARTIPGAMLVTHLFDIADKWKHQPVVDFVDRWTNDPNMWTSNSDANGFGGSGNGFMRQMWETYR